MAEIFKIVFKLIKELDGQETGSYLVSRFVKQ